MSASSIANRIPTLPRVAVVASLATALAIGLAAVYGYVDQYVRYRGFGPPVSLVAPRSQGRIVSFTFASKALGGRVVKPLVYVPAGYASHPSTRYPVLYLLHGTPGDPRTAFVNSLHLGPRMDALVRRRIGSARCSSSCRRVRPAPMPPQRSGRTARRVAPAGSRTSRAISCARWTAATGRSRRVRGAPSRATRRVPTRHSTRSSGIPAPTASRRPGAGTSDRRRERWGTSPRSSRTSPRCRRRRAGRPASSVPATTSTCTRAGTTPRCR